jgi:hypothetical protein
MNSLTHAFPPVTPDVVLVTATTISLRSVIPNDSSDSEPDDDIPEFLDMVARLLKHDRLTYFFVDGVIFRNELFKVNNVLMEIHVHQREEMFAAHFADIPRLHLGKFVEYELIPGVGFQKLRRMIAWSEKNGNAFMTILRFHNGNYFEEIRPEYRNVSDYSKNWIKTIDDGNKLEWFSVFDDEATGRSYFTKLPVVV